MIVFVVGAAFPLLFVVNLGRIKDPLGDDFQAVIGHLAEEAALVPLVTGGPADLLDLQKKGIAVAVEEDPAWPQGAARSASPAPR